MVNVEQPKKQRTASAVQIKKSLTVSAALSKQSDHG
jgi:hypothetical protein